MLVLEHRRQGLCSPSEWARYLAQRSLEPLVKHLARRGTRVGILRQGVEELDQEKLTPLLRLKYNDSIADAVADLGRPDEIGKMFAGFQRYLYQPAA